jgi:hypothetical protein
MTVKLLQWEKCYNAVSVKAQLVGNYFDCITKCIYSYQRVHLFIFTQEKLCKNICSHALLMLIGLK